LMYETCALLSWELWRELTLFSSSCWTNMPSLCCCNGTVWSTTALFSCFVTCAEHVDCRWVFFCLFMPNLALKKETCCVRVRKILCMCWKLYQTLLIQASRTLCFFTFIRFMTWHLRITIQILEWLQCGRFL
jgi:hypothetical protein